MIAYAACTARECVTSAVKAYGWRWIVSPYTKHMLDGETRYAVDNGAWTSHQAGKPFNVRRFEMLVTERGAGADFVVVPDIVAGGLASLEMSLRWLPWLRLALGPATILLIAVQDGMQPEHVEPHVGKTIGVFVGGSTEWKVATLPTWGRIARLRSCYIHVGRVNTAQRVRACKLASVHSFDGSSVTRWPKTIALLDRARRDPRGILGLEL